MLITPQKIQAEHLARQAYVYIRQSTMAQVYEHQESTRRQYELQQRARQLGWSDEQIVLIDQDLGHSAADVNHLRPGFERLLAAVVIGQAGAILGLEISRLARQDSEGHRLVEVAALTGTLLIDEQHIYDPRLPDDRLMLGLKVLLSSNELRLMGHRLWENKLRKAQRGELHINLPVGLLFDPHQGIYLDPDERVQAAIRLLFERFQLTNKINQVVRYFHNFGLEFPKRQGGWHGPLEWGALSCQRVRTALENPLYAGAYVFGRGTHRTVAKPPDKQHQLEVRLAPEDWVVTIWDAFPGYISRAEYETNQATLNQNRLLAGSGVGHRKDGAALLTGIVLCGRCGQRMQVVYSGRDSQHITYSCGHRHRRYAEPLCQRVPGQLVDKLITQVVLSALTPAQLDLSLAIWQELDRQQAELQRQWQLKLEAARYAVHLAQRRYEQVDPDNRLVARTLERQWEAALRQVELIEAEFAGQQRHFPAALDANQRQQLANLVQDLPQVWSAETTSWTERKELLQLLIADVTLTRQETDILIQIRWHTNQVDSFTVPLPIRGPFPISPVLIERIRLLSQTQTDAQIADTLNQDDALAAYAKSFTVQSIKGIRRRYGISKRSSNSNQL
jgi:DNA invertase Pin-like site-specific DNA recombinase